MQTRFIVSRSSRPTSTPDSSSLEATGFHYQYSFNGQRSTTLATLSPFNRFRREQLQLFFTLELTLRFRRLSKPKRKRLYTSRKFTHFFSSIFFFFSTQFLAYPSRKEWGFYIPQMALKIELKKVSSWVS